MLMRRLWIVGAMLVLATPALGAQSLTDRLHTGRMTVLQINRETGQFLCVEHRHWTSVVKADLSGIEPGDIVRVDKKAGAPARLVLLRHAADELGGSER